MRFPTAQPEAQDPEPRNAALGPINGNRRTALVFLSYVLRPMLVRVFERTSHSNWMKLNIVIEHGILRYFTKFEKNLTRGFRDKEVFMPFLAPFNFCIFQY